MLDDGNSVTEVSNALGVKFDDLWTKLRQKHQMVGYIPKLIEYLERETNAAASKRLMKHWQTIVKTYTKNFRRKIKATGGDTPETLGIRWGIKPSLIAKRLKEAGVMLESYCGVVEILNGKSINDVVVGLLAK